MVNAPVFWIHQTFFVEMWVGIIYFCHLSSGQFFLFVKVLIFGCFSIHYEVTFKDKTGTTT